MNLTELNIKNMVCDRCMLVVTDILEKLGLKVLHIELGRAEVENPEKISLKKINEALKKYGFELLKGKNQQLVEQIKTLLIQYVQESENKEELPNLSEYLANHIHQNYSTLSSVFSKSEDITIEKYLIHLKIERVKELLSYGELTLSEIAFKLNYSSVAHLSGQFKKTTGMSVTDYKKARDSFRQSLDKVR